MTMPCYLPELDLFLLTIYVKLVIRVLPNGSVPRTVSSNFFVKIFQSIIFFRGKKIFLSNQTIFLSNGKNLLSIKKNLFAVKKILFAVKKILFADKLNLFAGISIFLRVNKFICGYFNLFEGE